MTSSAGVLLKIFCIATGLSWGVYVVLCFLKAKGCQYVGGKNRLRQAHLTLVWPECPLLKISLQF